MSTSPEHSATQSPQPARERRTTRKAAERAGPQPLRPLPWEAGALAPVISARTVRIHYGKHHRGYVDKLNEAIEGTELAERSLEDIVRISADDPARIEVYRNAAQAWNHDFYWRSLRPAGGESPPAEFMRVVEESFESLADLKEQLAQAAIKQFGTGWAWLVRDGERLRVVATEDADNPLVLGLRPLVTIDVWEHAYYLDYQHDRAKHVRAVIERLMNWQFAAENFARGETHRA